MIPDFLTTYCPNEDIQNINQKLIGPLVYSHLCQPIPFVFYVRVQPCDFCLYKPLTLFFFPETLFVLPPEIKRCLLLGRNAMTKLDSKLKSRDITWPTKVHLVKAMVFPVVMYGCESWTIKKAEHRRIDAFELWCWRRLLRVHWTAKRSNQSILKGISPEYSLGGLMLKLKLQYFGHLM